MMTALIHSWARRVERPHVAVAIRPEAKRPRLRLDPHDQWPTPFTALPPEIPDPAGGYERERYTQLEKIPAYRHGDRQRLGSPPCTRRNKSGYRRAAQPRRAGFRLPRRATAWRNPRPDRFALMAEPSRSPSKHTGQGLTAGHAERAQGLMVAGADRVFHWADDVQLEPSRVVARCSRVPRPVAVRYAWAEKHPWANLFTMDGLPVQAFRSDNW